MTQRQVDDEVVLIVRFQAVEGRESELERILQRAVANANESDDDVVEFVLHRGLDDPRLFVIYERFVSLEALRARRERASTAEVRGRLKDLRVLLDESLVQTVASHDPPAHGEEP